MIIKFPTIHLASFLSFFFFPRRISLILLRTRVIEGRNSDIPLKSAVGGTEREREGWVAKGSDYIGAAMLAGIIKKVSVFQIIVLELSVIE